MILEIIKLLHGNVLPRSGVQIVPSNPIVAPPKNPSFWSFIKQGTIKAIGIYDLFIRLATVYP